jgi:hypothetical protein
MTSIFVTFYHVLLTASIEQFRLVARFPLSILSMLLFFLTKKVAQKSQVCAIALRAQPIKLFLFTSKTLLIQRILLVQAGEGAVFRPAFLIEKLSNCYDGTRRVSILLV